MAIHGSYKWRSRWPGNVWSRRAWLGAVCAPGVARAARQAEVQAFDLSLLDEAVTLNELFFVREHFPAPEVSRHDWRLTAAGRKFSYEELADLPLRTVAATLECAENPPGGGLVSHAVWEGVPLRAVMGKTPLSPFVRLRSVDGFSRTIPAEKALHADTLLVLRMNGAPLPPSHGGPLRAVVPGWYGMDAVKWLAGVEFTDEADTGPDYRRRTQSLFGATTGEPVTAMAVKSVFSRPVEGAILSGRQFLLRGAAWAGEARVAQVEVSTDDGSSWKAATMTATAPYCWALWQYPWRIAGAGEYRLAVRATDDRGNTQPGGREGRRADPYEQNAWQRSTVTVV